MVKTFDKGERVVWMMPRDEEMFTWFQIVRVANVQTVRWVLGALNGELGPVSTRRAQAWCARMEAAGMVDRAQRGRRRVTRVGDVRGDRAGQAESVPPDDSTRGGRRGCVCAIRGRWLRMAAR